MMNFCPTHLFTNCQYFIFLFPKQKALCHTCVPVLGRYWSLGEDQLSENQPLLIHKQ